MEEKQMKEYSLGTKCVQGGYTPGNGEPRQIPIVQSTTFKYETSEAMGRLFDLEEVQLTDGTKKTNHFKINATVSPDGKVSAFNMSKINAAE